MEESRSPEFTTAGVISREVIQATKDLAGRGPTQAKTYLHDECVVILMRDAHTVPERHLAEGGRQRDVAQTRVDLSEDARQEFIAIIEKHTGRKVVGFMPSSQQNPSLLSQVFVLENSPLLSAVPPGEPDASGD